jgi:hypothetical protein
MQLKKRSKKRSKDKTPTLSLKERLAQKRKVTQARKELVSTITTAVLGAIFVGIILGVVGGIKTAVGGIAAILCLSLSFKYPRTGLYAFLIYVPLGGTITYYLGSSPVLQLAKDAFYIPLLIGIVQACRKQRLPIIIPKSITAPLFILLGFCLLTLLFVNGTQQLSALQPTTLRQAQANEQPFLMGILGLKVFLGYLPLITCSYYTIRNKRDFLTITRLQIVIILICCGLAFIQFMMLRAGICEGTRNAVGADIFRASPNSRCFVGGGLLYNPDEGVIRLPGTFVAPWQWGWFLISSGFLTFASAFSDPSFRWRMVSLGSMASVLIMAVVSGQRIALGVVPVCLVILLFLTGQIVNLKRFIPVGIGLAIILGVAAINNPAIVQERVDSFIVRWNASPPQQFIMQQFGETWREQEGFLGNGLGRATNSARFLGNIRLIETYYPKVLHEVGIFGTLAFIVLVTTLTITCFLAYRSIKNRNYRTYAACLWLFILFISYNTYYYPLDVDPVAVYYWFFAGVLLKLPEIDKLEKLQEKKEEGRKKKEDRRKKIENPR